MERITIGRQHLLVVEVECVGMNRNLWKKQQLTKKSMSANY